MLSCVNARESDGKMVKPTELDIYFEPAVKHIHVEPSEPSFLLTQVSGVRKYLWRFSGDVRGIYERYSQGIAGAKEKVNTVYDNAVRDPLTLIRPCGISAAFVVGTLLPGRGRKKFLRLVSATATTSVAAAIAYPQRASQISVTAFNKGRGVSVSLVEYAKKKYAENKTRRDQNANLSMDREDSKHETPEAIALSLGEEGTIKDDNGPVAVSEEIENLDSASKNINLEGEKDEVAEESLKVSENLTEQDKSDEDKLNDGASQEGDYGQSSPEDKDMYSTR
eukprot:gene18135-19945_t